MTNAMGRLGRILFGVPFLFAPSLTGLASRWSKVTRALATSFLLGVPVARANSAPRVYFERALVEPDGAFSVSRPAPAEPLPAIRVENGEISLDVRPSSRGTSRARYRLHNLDRRSWHGPVVFLADARNVRVTLDGSVVATTEVSQHAREFPLHLGPGESAWLEVQFVVEPAGYSEFGCDRPVTDGLYRPLRNEPQEVCSRTTFSYPLWPVVGFGGGVGTMHVREAPAVAPDLRVTGDLVVPHVGGFSLGAETDVHRSVTGVASYQYGEASLYGSGYLSAGALAVFAPGPAAGFELGAGGRALILPLDVAVQMFPYRSEQAKAAVGSVRLLFGVKVGW